jgi:hypothetical protein
VELAAAVMNDDQFAIAMRLPTVIRHSQLQAGESRFPANCEATYQDHSLCI